MINDKESTTKNYVLNLDKEDNIVELIWNNSITNISFLFYNCPDITEINFSQNFTSLKITRMYRTYYGCTSLTSINISFFDTSHVTCICELFYNCQNLKYINMNNFNENSLYSEHIRSVFQNVPNDVAICINSNSTKIKPKIANKNCVIYDCSEDWLSKQKKYIDGKCYNSCSEHSL